MSMNGSYGLPLPEQVSLLLTVQQRCNNCWSFQVCLPEGDLVQSSLSSSPINEASLCRVCACKFGHAHPQSTL